MMRPIQSDAEPQVGIRRSGFARSFVEVKPGSDVLEVGTAQFTTVLPLVRPEITAS